jgi:RecA/RadA recombinase
MKKKSQVTQTESPPRDELVELLANELNKANKDGGKIAYFLDEQENPAEIPDWISTGSSMLDLAISNRPHGGLPVSRLCEFSGLEGSGKSLISAHVVANTQKKGGVAIIIDTENSAAPDFWKSLGVDLSKLLYVQCETVEDIFEKMEHLIGLFRKTNKDRLLTIIVDSVAAASTKAELESDHGKDGYATGKAIILSKAMRKVTTMIGKQKILVLFTNQLRVNINAMAFGEKYCVDPYTTKIKIRYILNNLQEIKEITIAEFAERFLGIDNFVPTNGDSQEIDISDLNIEIFGRDLKTKKDSYNRINKFVIKPMVDTHYSDGKLKGTDLHRIIEDGKEIHLKDHVDFKKVEESIKVVDFDIENVHNYYANDRLNHNTISGGKALAYHCSVRVRLNNTGKLKKDEEVIGNVCKAVVVKNRMGPPQRQANFDIYFDSGIADYSSWIKVLKDNDLIKQGGAYYTYKKDNGEEWKFQSKDFVSTLKTDAALNEEIYLKICDEVIMKYKDPNSQIVEDAVVDTGEDVVVSEE